MANAKQVQMLASLAREAGKNVNPMEFIDLNNGEIDAKVAEYERMGAVKRGNKKKQPSSFNELRAGMCCKLVVMQMGLGNIDKDPERYMARVLNLYRAVSKAFDLIGRSNGDHLVLTEKQTEVIEDI